MDKTKSVTGDGKARRDLEKAEQIEIDRCRRGECGCHIEDAQAPAVTVEDCAQFVKDAAAFIRWWSKTGAISLGAAFQTLVHDIIGLDSSQECFSPRVSGYAAKEAGR